MLFSVIKGMYENKSRIPNYEKPQKRLMELRNMCKKIHDLRFKFKIQYKKLRNKGAIIFKLFSSSEKYQSF